MSIFTRRRRRALAVSGIFAVVGALLVAPPALAATETAAGATDDTFTIVALPDTQKYTMSADLAPTMDQQTQWIVDSQAELNTKFVIQLGDLVESWPNEYHWKRASAAMKTLDDAGVPSSVLPGNHDLDITTGESSTYFPPSRYADASWNSDDVSYGGYLGQNQFGPDGIDRKNKDNYNLLTAGGVDLLILNLEFESPDYSLAWAQRVIDAYPDRKVILATHGYLNTAGIRSTATVRTDVVPTTAVDLWNDFVSENCSIFMVMGGHWAVGDLGESRRTDLNDCGQPVQQLLTDYQSRANGGDGWLRYYTFDPAAGTVDAYTYSPSLQQYETDDSSRFTLPVDFSPSQDEVLLSGGADWKWRNSTDAWPTGWNDTGFDDADWGSGEAPLGWGTGVETDIDLAPPTSNRARSMLFRKTIELSDVDELSKVTVDTRADDGVAVWVNGTLLGTSHLNSDDPASTTFADVGRSTNVATAEPVVFDVPPELLHDGENVVAASTHVNYLDTASATFDLVMTGHREEPAPPAPTPVTLVPTDAVWHYRYQDGVWPDGWTAATFDDSGWGQGVAPLGFGATDLATTVDVATPGLPRPLGMLFRRAFTVDDPSKLSDLVLTVRADDGVVVTVNGTEVGRMRMSAAVDTPTSYATSAPNTASAVATPLVIDIPASALHSGTNVIAASTHLNYRATPGVSFVGSLVGKTAP